MTCGGSTQPCVGARHHNKLDFVFAVKLRVCVVRGSSAVLVLKVISVKRLVCRPGVSMKILKRVPTRSAIVPSRRTLSSG